MLLERDAQGRLYGEQARLADAVKEYRELKTGLDYPWFDDDLLMALFRSGSMEEMKALAAESAVAESGLVMQVVATAVQQGAAAAQSEASRLRLDAEGVVGQPDVAAGIEDALRAAGVRPGDEVQIGEIVFEFSDD